MTSQKPDVLAKTAASCVLLVGVMVLLGWTFNIPTLKRILAGWPKVSPITMLAFLFAGISLWCAASAKSNHARIRHRSETHNYPQPL